MSIIMGKSSWYGFRGHSWSYRSDWGLTLYQQRAFITQLEPGEYTSHWESSYYGVPWAAATVHIVVLPDAE